jgi:AraC-like DNA-binding protein
VPLHSCPRTPSYEAVDIEGFDPDALSRSVKDTRMEIRVLRGGAPLGVTLRRVFFRDATLESGRISLPVLGEGSFPKDHICLGFKLDGQGPGNINGQAVLPGSVRFFAEGAELTYRTAASANWTTFHVDREALQREAVALLGRPLPLPDRGWVNMLPTAAGIPLGQRIRKVLSIAARGADALTVDSAAGLQAALLGAYVRALAEGLRLDLRPLQRKAANRARIVRGPREYLLAHLGEPFSMRTLCEITATTERTLQYAFHDVYGMSPQAWFQTMRLNEVHRELRAAGPGHARIADVATRWGFTHLGRFSIGYRELFGERPSDTLARH